MEIIMQPWPWYVSGPLISLVMLLLLLAGGEFGVSANLRSFCAMGGAGKHCDFFEFDWKSQLWNIFFIIGAVLGGYIASTFLSSSEPLELSASTVQDLEALGITFSGGLLPTEFFSWGSLSSLPGIMILVVGGFLVGFGARYAGGCTSGHAISGLSNLQLPSLIAVIGFFLGGLFMTYVVFPIIF